MTYEELLVMMYLLQKDVCLVMELQIEKLHVGITAMPTYKRGRYT